jgi:alpha-tubulin suppressor-like RCC1 family protein
VPTLVTAISGYEVIEVASGKSHTLFLTSCGKVFAAGSNDNGQCGQGRKTANLEIPKVVPHEGPDIISVAAGAEFSVMLDKEGKVWTFGHPENGTLGHNDDGKFMQKANKVEFRCEFSPKQVMVWVEKDTKAKEVTHLPQPTIKKISCGPNHTVAVDVNNKAYSWGFGGYGRLGHSETADELVPRLIKYLDGKNRGVKDVVCGAAFNMGISEIPGMVNMWGIYTTSKEANMYPKPVQDLSGWSVRSIACSTKGWTVACDDSVIACQPSPCYGELGNGDKKKSSAAPCMVDTLDGLHVIKVGAGPAHTIYIVRYWTVVIVAVIVQL